MTPASPRAQRIASALAAPIDFGSMRGSLGGDAERKKRYLVVVAAAHLRKLLPPADCSRELLTTLTRNIERVVTRSPGAKGVNTKFIQRDDLCDMIYRRIRGLAAKAPRPRCPDGTLMSRAQLEASVASDRWWISAIEARREAYANESEDDLEAFRELIIQPMPVEERVRLYAPPIVAPARILVARELKRASDEQLAVLYKNGRRRRRLIEAALRKDVVERARKLAVVHRRLLGVG